MNVLVVAPHPDDESIGMGGTIANHVRNGDRVEVLFVTGGEKGVHTTDDWQEARALRYKEAGQASYCLGSHELYMLTLRDGEVPNNDERLALAIAKRAIESHVDRLYGPSPYDSHPDHVAVSEAVTRARAIQIFDLWEYEIWTPHHNPTAVVDITPFATAKRAAIRGYKSQQANAFDEAILALNHYRGLLHFGGSGVMYAEAFREVP